MYLQDITRAAQRLTHAAIRNTKRIHPVYAAAMVAAAARTPLRTRQFLDTRMDSRSAIIRSGTLKPAASTSASARRATADDQ
jgi:hypothetical protein